jgi:hypothetical protein
MVVTVGGRVEVLFRNEVEPDVLVIVAYSVKVGEGVQAAMKVKPRVFPSGARAGIGPREDRPGGGLADKRQGPRRELEEPSGDPLEPTR